MKKIASAPIKVVFDAVSEAKTQNVAYKALAPGGTLAIVLPSAVEKVDPDKRIIQTQGNTNIPQHRKLGANLYSKITSLLEEGAVKVSTMKCQSIETWLRVGGYLQPNPVEVLPNGLEGIIKGLDKLKQGVHNVKLVGHPQETA